MFQGYIANRWGDKMFEAEIAKVVKRRAFWSALIVALPLLGIEWVIFTIILWSMYSTLCKKTGTKLRLGTIVLGIVVNVVVIIVIDIVFSFLPVLGWLGTGFLVYLQFYLSGKLYIETLRKTSNNHSNIPSCSNFKQDTSIVANKVTQLMELHEAGYITQEELNEQITKL